MGIVESKYSENYQNLRNNFGNQREGSNPSIGGFYILQSKYYPGKFVIEKINK